MTADSRNARIITFYSYKGGTGRSMALANIAWLLANAGRRVLVIDWDLEAPGLHRYFEPFLDDKSLERSTGVIDFVRDFAAVAVSTPATATRRDQDWYRPYSNLLKHAVPLDWEFPDGGSLDLVAAGRQDAAYALRVNSFDWQEFYERLGGGILLETVKATLRPLYDFVLIDSRTGVSDTSGICTIQMPDALVVCFTLNRQSIYGASAAARSAFRQRHTNQGEPTLTVWPVPMRVEYAEKDRLEVAQGLARARFSGLMGHLDPEEEESYWSESGVPYEPYYAYEEVLATFRERTRATGSVLASLERLATHLLGTPVPRVQFLDEERRIETIRAFTTHSASDSVDELTLLGQEYEQIRVRMPAGTPRTRLMNSLVQRAQQLAGQREAGRIGEQLFTTGSPGARVVGLALARKEPQRRHIELALSGISNSVSPFEQYHALLLARALLRSLHPSAAQTLRVAIEKQLNKTITKADPSRWDLARAIVQAIGPSGTVEGARTPRMITFTAGLAEAAIIETEPSTTYVRYTDVDERHGEWVHTRGDHTFHLPRQIRLGRHLVTNELFRQFVEAGGYDTDEFWNIPHSSRGALLTRDGMSMGPGDWLNGAQFPEGREQHPVRSMCWAEACAFVNWCNAATPPESPWKWALPPEDQWEFMARSEAALIYPWGDVFDAEKCNSAERGLDDTTPVTQFESGASQAGCCDMAGNLWEFVEAADAGSNWCVLRGGSFKNDRFTVRTYLRLSGVPRLHRPPDFGFRLAQVSDHLAPRA